MNFNPRSPWGERRYVLNVSFLPCKFQSTLSVRRATWEYDGQANIWSLISIHALREESDTITRPIRFTKAFNFNPRSPWGERLTHILLYTLMWQNFNPRSPWGERHYGHRLYSLTCEFQSTLSVRRATTIFYKRHLRQMYFNPRSPWGERPPLSVNILVGYWFQSTLSVRRATPRQKSLS